ncbi:Ubiquitin carboxyl-terminal hydrolase 16 [Taenia solium]|eukprot:TsM_000402100 transcript=TsM_000402100 gene=TsM_000402100
MSYYENPLFCLYHRINEFATRSPSCGVSKASQMTKQTKRRDHGGSQVSPKGLHNLGNTCYLNSALQCLSRVSGLKIWIDRLMCSETMGLLKRFTDKGDTISLKLCLSPRNSPLSAAYSTFVGELLGAQNPRTSITPRPIFSELVNLYPRFNDYGQHDSHEALRYILDGLRQEESRLWQSAILTELKFTSKSTEETKQEVRAWGKSTSLCTAVDRIFGGVMLTSLMCKQCNHISLHFEVFLDLSLPILTDEDVSNKRPHHNANSVPKTKRELKKERKAKGKKNMRKDRDRKYLEQATEDNGYIDYDEKIHDKHKSRSSKKGKYSRVSWNDEWDMGDEEDEPKAVSEDGEEAEVEQRQVDTKDKASSTPGHTPENDECEDEPFDLVENGSSEGVLLSPSEKDALEADTKAASIEPTVGVEEASAKNGMESKKDFHEGGTDAGSGLSSSSLNGENADLEDNVDDVNSRLSDGSLLTLPVLRDPEESLCKDLATKLRISSAGDETAIAQPAEEAEAKTISVCPISSTLPPEPTELERCLAKFIEATELIGANRTICEQCTERAGGGSDDGDTDGVLCDTVKRDLIIKPPAVLTLHLKRYVQCGHRLQKCSKRVTFPINLDLRPYCSRLARLSSGEGQYRLFGVVEHSGQLRSGHYVCYIAEESNIPADQFVASLEKPDPWPLHLYHLVCQLHRGDQRVIHGDLDDTCIDEESKNADTRTWYHISDTHVTRASVSTVLNAQPYLLFYQRVR